MKKSVSIILALFMLVSFASCGGDKAGTSSNSVSSSDSSFTASFEKPEKVEHDGNNPGNYGGVTLDVSNSVTELQSSLDNYKCEAQWIDDVAYAVFYIYNIEVMPNYFEPRLMVQLELPTFSSEQAPYNLSGYAIGAKTFRNGFVAVFKESVEIYGFAYQKTASYKAESVTAFDVSLNGDVVYIDKGKVMLNGEDAGLGLTDATSCAISEDGTKIAAGNQTKGVFLNNGAKTEVDLESLDKRYEILFTDEAVFFAGRPRAGVKLTAEKISFDGTKTTLSYGEKFENTYARGSVFENNGDIYLVSSLTQSIGDFGDLEITKLDGDLKPTSEKISLAGGYSQYHRYNFSDTGKLLFTENLAADGVKNYIHFIEE